MSETALDGSTLRFPDQHEANFQQNMANNSTEAGYPTTAAEVDPGKNTIFANLKKDVEEKWGDTVHVIGSTGTVLSGEEASTYVRTTPDAKVLSIAGLRELKRKYLNKKAA